MSSGATADTVVCADAIDFLRTLADGSVNCCVTSPPYFGLRDYGVDGQIGLEPTPQQFIATMVAVFREVRRVLRDDGTCWINLGDTYSNAGKWGGNSGYDTKQSTNSGSIRRTTRNAKDIGAKEKELLMIPARAAIALSDDGWYLRSEIVWHKPSVMPESVTDRPTKAHEMVYLLTKQPDYWYDQDAIREPHAPESLGRYEYGLNSRGPADGYVNGAANNPRAIGHSKQMKDNINMAGRNKRTVWTVNPEPTAFAHFATFPRKLIEPMILAGCPDEVCSACGAPYERCVEVTGGTIGTSWHDHSADMERGMTQGKHSGGVGNARNVDGQPYTRVTTGWQATCTCDAGVEAGIVLDPFMGSGTTALAARALGRHYIGCDLNPEYVALARERLRQPFEQHYVKANNDVSDLPLFSVPASD